ncbi:trans-aconitate 2-methyltransferase [Actinoplanes sp. NBRC 103695]|uniref:trans-aconitate 2-methyltransferase n=1 Tax=Actinoplanes sp. NBRC 103695 TaxID=3032202 RepID=UPI0024A58751|nr:trans-aconitate 2-methyltransferase [Actinoplanes sp. NBRC 103695]GLY95993.1 trans-aconitate 2-methyltransferase [Actinoplanes sp. NBRC 103695]
MWDPAIYQRYGDERSRPFFDLVARVGAEKPRAVVDLGCGPGQLTATLAQRWPGARVTGVDSSPEMVARARDVIDASLGDVREWRPADDVDVLVTNATLQWVPGHPDLLVRWAHELPAGAWIAMQVPGNFDAPSHRALREVGAGYGLGDVLREAPVLDPAGYAALFGGPADAWETTYLHLLPEDGSEHPVLRWMEGTALRPVRARLDDAAWQDFRDALAARLADAYPARDGLVAFPFRRIFVVART